MHVQPAVGQRHFQLLDGGGGDHVLGKLHSAQALHPGDVFQPRVGHLRPCEVQGSQVIERGQVLHSCVPDQGQTQRKETSSS